MVAHDWHGVDSHLLSLPCTHWRTKAGPYHRSRVPPQAVSVPKARLRFHVLALHLCHRLVGSEISGKPRWASGRRKRTKSDAVAESAFPLFLHILSLFYSVVFSPSNTRFVCWAQNRLSLGRGKFFTRVCVCAGSSLDSPSWARHLECSKLPNWGSSLGGGVGSLLHRSQAGSWVGESLCSQDVPGSESGQETYGLLSLHLCHRSVYVGVDDWHPEPPLRAICN